MPKGKGSSPAGNTTTTTVNPTQQLQQPYLADIFKSAQDLYRNTGIQQYYPGQTLTDQGRDVTLEGYGNLGNTGRSFDQFLRPVANSVFSNAAGGSYGVQNSPAYGGYQQYAQGTAGPQQTFQGIASALAGQAPGYADLVGRYAQTAADYGAMGANTDNFGLNALRGGPGVNQLISSASGEYLNKNPYLDRAIQAAQDPVVRNYQTSVTPQLGGLFSGGGRYGSGAMAGAADTAQRNLAQGLGDISTNLSNADYGRERSLQDQAAQAYNQGALSYGQLRNQGVGLGITGATAAGNIANAAGNTNLGYQREALSAAQQQALAQQYGLTGLQSGYQSGNAAALGTLSQLPNIEGAQDYGTRRLIEQGTGEAKTDQDVINDLRARFEGTQYEPWKNLSLYQSAIGGAIPGSSATTQPYFQNQFADTLSGLTGAAGLAQKLGAFGGASGLAGATFPATSAFGSLFPGAAASSLGAYAAAPGGAEIISGLGGLGAAGGTAAETGLLGAATVICTELRRQNRMPRRHYFASARHDAKIPAVIRRGYHFWAIPSVRHLRRRPDSLYSRFLCTVFNWRAEDLAARVGVRGARKLWRGRALTCVLCVPCLVLGFLVPEPDWRSVYSLKTTT